MKRILLIWAWVLLGMLAVLTVSPPAYAHKIMVFGYLEGERVHLEGYFADGKKAEYSLVEVFSRDGRKILEGKTDGQGAFSFPVPDVPEIHVVLTGSMGHRAECNVELEKKRPSGGAAPGMQDKPSEEAGKGIAATEVTGKPLPRPPAEIPESGPEADAGMPAVTAVGEDRIRAVITEELDRKLSPIHRELALLGQEKTSLRDIIGGIGYIAGIMGIILYFKVRRGSGA
jgi:nickel transport protein